MKIDAFCINDKAERQFVRRPFTQGDFTYATDGIIIIRVPEICGYEIAPGKKPYFPDVSKLKWDHEFENHSWEEPPKLTPSDIKPCLACDGTGLAKVCRECDGEGMVEYENDYNVYDWRCKSCDGDGYEPGESNECLVCFGTGKNLEETRIKFGNRYFSAYYIYVLNKEFNNVKFSKHGDENKYAELRFLFDGGCGILMPMS